MLSYEFEGINSFLVGISNLLLLEGVQRNVRGKECVELSHPILIKIRNPLSRIVTIKERRWNTVLPYAESLWLATGRNDIEMIGSYLKKMYEFSDDNSTMRAGYGPRLRYYTGTATDYHVRYGTRSKSNLDILEVDQFKFIEKVFQKDPFSRQGIITITDPAKDYFTVNGDVKTTKDFPCTNNIQFIRREDFLDLIVHMRSNDFLWGATAVNIFNFTFLQEYFAQILHLKVGHYYHLANNLHFYIDFKDRVEEIAAVKNVVDPSYEYEKKFDSLWEFDEQVGELEKFEEYLRKTTRPALVKFGDDFFDDWAKVLYINRTKDYHMDFANPILNVLYKEKLKIVEHK